MFARRFDFSNIILKSERCMGFKVVKRVEVWIAFVHASQYKVDVGRIESS